MIKSIWLENNKKDMLLEMCNSLLSDEGKFSRVMYGILYYNPYNAPVCSIDIHWLEICMLHLPEKVFTSLVDKGVEGYADNGYMKWVSDFQFTTLISKAEKCPIEYLYKEFEKLKV